MIKHFILLSLSTMLCVNTQAAELSQQKTIDNLTVAYRGETNANHRYTLFAQKAEAEGYAQVAKLFRAAAQSEAIHRELHKSAIISLGSGAILLSVRQASGYTVLSCINAVNPGAKSSTLGVGLGLRLIHALVASVPGASFHTTKRCNHFVARLRLSHAATVPAQ
jgi:rubrerythrin